MNMPAHLPEVPPQVPRANLLGLMSWGVLTALLGASWKGADLRPLDLLRDSGNMAEYATSFFPPNFRDWRYYLQEMVVTLQIALWGTALAVVCAAPLALLCSANIAPVWIRQPVRRLVDAARATNGMVFAMLFIVPVVLGPFAGVLALWIHTTAVLAKRCLKRWPYQATRFLLAHAKCHSPMAGESVAYRSRPASSAVMTCSR